MATNDTMNVVFVHRGFVDGSAWKRVYRRNAIARVGRPRRARAFVAMAWCR